DERGEHKSKRRLGGQRIDSGRRRGVRQPGATPRAAEVGAEQVVAERQHGGRRGPRVDDEGPPEVAAGWHPDQPPASALRKKTVSPLASGSSPSLVIWSPFSAATTCPSRASPSAAAAPATVAARTGCRPR